MLTTLLGSALALPVLNYSAPASLDAGVFAKNASLRSIGRPLAGEPSCGCADGQASADPTWERLATSNEGYRCIGGCGGSPFVWHASGSMVEKITCWRSNDDIQGLRVKFFNDLNEYNAGITSGSACASVLRLLRDRAHTCAPDMLEEELLQECIARESERGEVPSRVNGVRMLHGR